MPKVQKEIIVLGDIEMGAGSLTDDFISDKALSQVIKELTKRPHQVDLVLNGDTFDFLKCPHIVDGKITYPRRITQEISIDKLHYIYKAHQKVFKALEIFVQNKSNNLYFILGNHDQDLVYPGVRNGIRNLLKTRKNIHFPGLRYKYKKVYVEHGHQYDFLSRISFDHIFLNYKGISILNLPFVYFGLISKFMHLKEKHPFLERIFPRPTLLKYKQAIQKEVTWRTVVYFIKSIFYYPFRYYFDPTYTLPRGLFNELFRRLKSIDWDVDNVIDIFKMKRIRILKQYKIHVLGHIHEKYVEDKKGKVIIHPGAWRDEYDLKDKKLIPREKRYVQILFTESGRLEYQLIVFPIKRKILNFNKVKDEIQLVKEVAKEEGFKPILV